jgi:hypothetical protein
MERILPPKKMSDPWVQLLGSLKAPSTHVTQNIRMIRNKKIVYNIELNKKKRNLY